MTTMISNVSTLAVSDAPSRIARHAPTVARVLLGSVFFGFGSAGLLHLLPPPSPNALPHDALVFSSALFSTGYMIPLIKGTETLAGAFLLANRFVPLALALLAPVLVNIFAFHAFLERSGLGMAVVLLALELCLAWKHRAAYRSMLRAKSQGEAHFAGSVATPGE